MERINVTLDAETLDLLARIGRRFGITDRSSAIRFAAHRIAQEERIMNLTATQCTLFWFDRPVIDNASPAMLDLTADLEAAAIERVTGTDDMFGVAQADAEQARTLAEAHGFALREEAALVLLTIEWDGPYPVGAFTDATGDGLIIPLTLKEA